MLARAGHAHVAEPSLLREGLRGEEGSPSGGPPREERVFASIADELAEIRKTVRAWRA